MCDVKADKLILLFPAESDLHISAHGMGLGLGPLDPVFHFSLHLLCLLGNLTRLFTHENGLLVAQTELAFEHIASPRKARGLPSG